jgi:hypothetical protein
LCMAWGASVGELFGETVGKAVTDDGRSAIVVGDVLGVRQSRCGAGGRICRFWWWWRYLVAAVVRWYLVVGTLP